LQTISRRIAELYQLKSQENCRDSRHRGPELDYAGQRGKVTSVPQQVSLPNQGYKVGFGTIAAALAALSLAVLGHFFI
jgi:hypothetical protein